MKNKILRNMLIPGVVAVLAVVIPALLIQIGVIDGYNAQVITLGGVNAIMAISVNMVCGITGQLSLGQAGFQAIGAYSVILLCTKLNVPMPLAIVAGGLIAAFFGFLIGFPTLKLEGDYLAIVTLAFGEIILVVLTNLKNLTGGPNGLQFSTLFTTSLDYGALISYLSVIGTLVIIIILLQNFLRSTYGRAILSVREDEVAANSTGISVFRYKMIGFVIASFIGGIGGALYAPFIGFVKPDLASFNNSINELIYVVLGGMGSITGGVVAAFVLTILQEVLRFLKDYRLLIYPVILILVMLFRPQGLLGNRELSFVGAFDYFAALIKGKKSSKKAVAKAEEKGVE
ncbi:MAG TPA: branched-chain amino acid ABC transporter permease [Treponema sp.]|nr:branched-chain amino acid ABC transporter permease [Treponema sp.]HCA20344.1 branched-chain amino acid ABC transporter permease [Treponema sp.]